MGHPLKKLFGHTLMHDFQDRGDVSPYCSSEGQDQTVMSMYDAAVITAIYDAYDILKPVCPQKGLNIDWVFVTDNPPEDSLGWRVVHEPRPGVHPNRAAKRPKFLPWEYTDASRSIWVDASFRILSDTFVSEALSFADPISQFTHPWRDCLYEETEASLPLTKYEPDILRGQADSYKSIGHPEHWGLWATGVIARLHTPRVRLLGERWTGQVESWSYQDQVSQPYVLRETELRPTRFPGTHLANGWMQYEGSERH